MTTCLPLLSLLLIGEPTATPTGQEKPDLDVELICQGIDARPMPTRGSARFVIARNGDVAIGGESAFTVAWADDTSPILRIDVHRGGKLLPVACGRTKGGQAYLVDERSIGRADYAVVQVFGQAHASEASRTKEVREAAEKRLATPELAWQHVLWSAGLSELRAAAMRSPAEADRAIELGNEGLRDLADANQGASAWEKALLAQLPKAKELLVAVEKGRQAVSEAEIGLNKAASAEAAAGAAVAEKRRLQANAESAVARARTAAAKAEAQRALHASQEALKEAEAAKSAAGLVSRKAQRGLDEARAGLQAAVRQLPEQPAPGEVKTYCEGLATMNWSRSIGVERRDVLLVRAELPMETPPQMVTANYGEGLRYSEDVKGDRRLELMLLDVPTEERITTRLQLGEKAPGAAEALVNFAMILRQVSFREVVPSAVCDGRGDLRVDASAQPLARFGSRVAVAPGIRPGRTATFLVCAGDDCPPDKAGAALRNKVELSVLPVWRLTVLLELGGTVPLSVRGGKLRADGFGKPVFEPIGGASGPDQLYQLRQKYDGRESYAASALLAVQHHRHLGAVGPTVWTGGSSGPSTLTQWNARYGYVLGDGIVLTTGATMRVVKSAIDYGEGDVISVPRPATGSVQAPEPRTRDRLAFGWGLGIAVDLAVLSDAGAGIMKFLGVK